MRIQTAGQQATITLEGWERLWALTRRLTVSATNIISLQWFENNVPKSEPKGFRLPGTNVPRWFYAGSFWRSPGWEFWYIKAKQPGYVVISTNVARFRRIILTTDKNTAEKLVIWFNKYQQTKNIA